MLLAIGALRLSLRLKCDFDPVSLNSREFQSQHCRDFFYKTLKLPAKPSINCSGVVQGEQEAVIKARLDNLEIKKKRQPFTDADYLDMTRDCKEVPTVPTEQRRGRLPHRLFHGGSQEDREL